MKIRANSPPLYSTLNPETNSLSPSTKSNGVRLDSAKHVISHMITRGGAISAGVRAPLTIVSLIAIVL